MLKIQKQIKLQIWGEQFLYRLLYAASAAVITSLTGTGLTMADIVPFSGALFSEIAVIIVISGGAAGAISGYFSGIIGA